jgi:uncharacterized protein YndB with AHSA1/START domain
MADLTISRALTAHPDAVWRAWTTDEISVWLWPPLWETAAEIDLEVGGQYRLSSVVANIAVSGSYVVVDAPSRLVMTWRWDDDDAETLVSVSIVETERGGTMLTVLHENLPSDEDRDSHIQGWNDCLDRLPDVLG